MTATNQWRFCVAALCAAAATLMTVIPLRAQEKIQIVASFSILGDFAKNVGGDQVNVTTLVGPNSDVHVYTPAPADAKKIADAKLVIINNEPTDQDDFGDVGAEDHGHDCRSSIRRSMISNSKSA